jgi:tRNA dimethylallyltransferase
VILGIVGPTATGKTRLACELAPALGCEIVCVDSMTIYRGMNIGTAKPGYECGLLRHHLLDIADPGEAFTVARFQGLARAAMEEIRGRGKTPMLVGGSGLYYQAVVDELTFPPTDADVRARLEREPVDVLAGRLAAADPIAARFIDPANKRRLVRALEVIELTDEPFSSFRRDWDRRADPVWAAVRPVRIAGLDADTEALRERIRARARAMIEGGLLREVELLVAQGFRDALTAPQAVGYAQAIEVLDERATTDEFVERTTRATAKLVQRQRAWFRRDPRIRWFDATDPTVTSAVRSFLAERDG